MKKASITALAITLIMLSNQLAFSQRQGSENTPPPICSDAALGAAWRFVTYDFDGETLSKDIQSINNIVQGRLNLDDRRYEQDFAGSIFRIFQNTFRSVDFFRAGAGLWILSRLAGEYRVPRQVLLGIAALLIAIMATEAAGSFSEELALWGGLSRDEASVIANEVRGLVVHSVLALGNNNIFEFAKVIVRGFLCSVSMGYGHLKEEWGRWAEHLARFYGSRGFPPTYFPRDPIDPNPDPTTNECPSGRVLKWVCEDRLIPGIKGDELVLTCGWKCVVER